MLTKFPKQYQKIIAILESHNKPMTAMELVAASDGHLKRGTVYRRLSDLEVSCKIESQLDPDSQHGRRLYSIPISEQVICPQCLSNNLSGLYSSFWAALNRDGSDMAVNFSDHESSTELGTERICQDCNHEFDSDE